MSLLIRSIACYAGLIIPFAANAQDGPVYTPAVGTGSLVQVSFSLLMVLIVIIAVAWLLKRMNLVQQGAGNLLKIVGSIAIGQRERIVLVEIEDTWLLVGVGPGQIRTLHQMEKSEYAPDDAANSAEHKKFASLLSSMVKSGAHNGKRDAS